MGTGGKGKMMRERREEKNKREKEKKRRKMIGLECKVPIFLEDLTIALIIPQFCEERNGSFCPRSYDFSVTFNQMMGNDDGRQLED